MLQEDPLTVEALREAVEGACRPGYVPKILWGRARVLQLPRAWVLEHVERVAAEAVDWTDAWEYHRLLELYALLDPALAQRAAERGLSSPDPDVRDPAERFGSPAYVATVRRHLRTGLLQVYPELEPVLEA